MKLEWQMRALKGGDLLSGGLQHNSRQVILDIARIACLFTCTLSAGCFPFQILLAHYEICRLSTSAVLIYAPMSSVYCFHLDNRRSR